jgi:phosphate acetyltransferase
MSEPTQIRSSSDRPHAKYDYLIARAKQVPAAQTVVVHPCDETSLRGAAEAAEIGIITPILVGPAAKITAAARQHKIDIGGFTLVDAPHSDKAPARSLVSIDDVGVATAFLAHDAAKLMTGDTVYIDGGYHIID